MIWIIFMIFVPQMAEFTLQNLTSPCTDQNHIFLAPGVLASGGNSRACVSRFHAEGPAIMIVTLFTEQESATAHRELPAGDGGCVDISVPQLPNTKAELVVNIRYPETGCNWERRTPVRIAGSKVVVVHSERARYRPGDTFRARVFTLKSDLTPAHGAIDEIWIEGPRASNEGIRVREWGQVRTRLGIAQVEYELDPLAPPGKWTVAARLADGSQGSSVFSVGNYELPPFQLSVRHAPKVLRTSERLVWTVCVRYPWTEAVEGMLVIRLRGLGTSWGVRTAVRLRAPRACHRHAAAARRVALHITQLVVADFSFQEEGTRIWQNTTVVSQVVDKPITLEFLTKHRAVIEPGLPYKLKVKATRWDNRPATNELVRVCRSAAHVAGEINASNVTNAACDEASTDEKGIAKIMFTVEDSTSSLYKFEASLSNDSNTTAPPLVVSVGGGGPRAALGTVRGDTRGRSLVPLYLQLETATPLTVHFVVLTRGGIIYRWGATTQCPTTITTNNIQTTTKDNMCQTRPDQLGQTGLSQYDRRDTNSSDSLLDRHLLRIMLPVKLTPQMCPDSDLIVYFYHNGEFISASKHFEFEECFANEVEATFQSRQTPPGSTATLQLSTPGPAICALTALDSAAKWTHPGESIKDVIMHSLRRLIDGHRNLTEYDTAGNCYLNSENSMLPTKSLDLAATWFSSAGVKLLGGGTRKDRRCDVQAPSPLVVDDATVPRSDFSEAWLWRLVTIGPNGTTTTTARAPDSITRYEATAFCVAKNGVAISPPAVLQVFHEFFIHADSPSRLRRGDTAIIRYRIFNYLYEQISVQIQILADPHLHIPSDYVESFCISARSSIARRVSVDAAIPGAARLSVRAKAVDDFSCGTVRSGVSDEVIIKIKVEPEGVPVKEHQSVLLCGEGSEESSESKVSWSWPAVHPVPGTEALTVWAIGDITGPLLADADSLVTLPRGCGEQNMARLATNLLALKQLPRASAAAAAAKEHVARGFTRQLQYMHPSGGFSAFGAADPKPSTWLTAFTLRYLLRAHQVLSPGSPVPSALDLAERWLLSQQMENGCFRNEGQVFHKELRGGLNEEGEIASVALTAYVISSLVESSITLPSRIIRNTLSCLRALPTLKNKTSNRIYAQALLSYTFMRLRRYEEEVKLRNDASLLKEGVGMLEREEEMKELMELVSLARRTGGYVWWETGSLSSSIEATGYALLALALCPLALRDSCASDARAAVRWLQTHRGATGGFSTTQDTLVALEALIKWSMLQPSSPTNLTVTAQSGALTTTVSLYPEVKVPDVMKMGVGDQLSVHVQGTGCALIQATRSYNSVSVAEERDKLLSVQVSVHTDGPFNCDVNGTNCFCAAVVEACVVWVGEFPEMALLEVSLPGGFGADAALLYAQLQPHNTLLRRIELTPSTSKATLYLGTIDGSSTLNRGGHQCYELHAVGPTARTKSAYARVLHYYRPEVNDTQMYTIPENCPPRISHDVTNKYLVNDNLYNKAKSLSDDDEIIITEEFSFEDIPEGIPLQDPLYDNLKEKDLNESIIDVTETRNNKDEEIVTRAGENSNLNEDSNKIDGSRINLKDNAKEIPKIVDIKQNDIKNKENYKQESNEIQQSINSNIAEERKPKVLDTAVFDQEIEPINDSKSEMNNEAINLSFNAEGSKVKEQMGFKNKNEVENPKLSDFHVINSDRDLEVPSGVNGPVPVYVIPPQNLVGAPQFTDTTPHQTTSSFINSRAYTVPYYATYFTPNIQDSYYLRNFRRTVSPVNFRYGRRFY